MPKPETRPVLDPEPAAGPEPQPDPEPDPRQEIVLETRGGRTVVRMDSGHQYAVEIDGTYWEHCGEDAAGRWIYRHA